MSTINGPDNASSNSQLHTEVTEEVSVGSHNGHSVSQRSGEKTPGLTEGSLTVTPLSEQTVETRDVKTPLLTAGLIDRSGAERLDSRSKESLNLLLDTPWMKERLKSSNPLSEADLDQLCQAAFQLDEQIQSGAAEHTLAWRADSMLGERIDTSSPEQLTGLVSKTLNSLEDKAKAMGLSAQEEALKEAQTSIDDIDANGTPAEKLVAVSNALKALQTDKPDLVGRELLNGLQDHVTDQLKGIAREEFKEALGSQLKSLEKGGSKQEYILGFELGVAAAHLVGVNVGIRYTFDASALDDTRIMDRSTLTGNIDLVIGQDLAVRADVGASLSGAKGKLFENLDDFVDYHANDILPVLLESATKAPKNIKGVIKARQSDSLHAKLVADKPKLQQELIAHCVLNPGDRLVVEDRRRSEFTEVSEKAGAIKAQINVLDDMLSGSYTVSNTHSEFRRHVPVQDAFHSNPELLVKEPSRYFSVFTQGQSLTGSEGQKWIESNSQLLDELNEAYSATVKSDQQKAKVIKGMAEQARSHLRKAMAALYAEYDHYSAVVNRYDGKDDSGDIRGDLGDLKHRLEKSRGSNGRGEFLRAVSATHARLSDVYQNSFTPELPPTTEDKEAGRLFNRMEAEYRMPQLHLTDKQVKGSLHMQTSNKSSQTNHVGEIKARIPHTPILLSAAFRKEHIKGHFNPDMNGDYINVSCRVDAGASVQEVIGALSPHIISAVESSGSKLLATSLPTDMTFNPFTAGQLECHFVKAEDGYCLQYMRFSGEKGIGGATPEIPVVAGPWGDVKVKIQAAHHQRSNLKEYVGNNTLTYMFTRYNGWADGGKASEHIPEMRKAGQSDDAGADYWDQFVHNNESQIKKAMKYMADPEKNIAMEMNSRLEDIGDDRFSSQLRDSLETYSNYPSEENFKTALGDFNEFMARSHQVDKTTQQNAFTLKTKK